MINKNRKKTFINSAIVENNIGKIEMYGDVYNEIPKDWWTGEPICEQAITLKDFKEALKQVENCSKIELHMNSYGGDATVGITIHNLLKSTNKPTVCIVEGIAASAAFTIATGCDEVLVYPGSIMMCHKVKSFLSGFYESGELAKEINGNDAYDKATATMYAEKTGMSVTQCLNLMAKETWMTAQEAIQYGFANKLIEGDAQLEIINKSTLKINGIEHNRLNIPENILNKKDIQNLGGNDMSLFEKFKNHFDAFFQNLEEEQTNNEQPAVEAPGTNETDNAPEGEEQKTTVEALANEEEAPVEKNDEKDDALKAEYVNAERTRLQEIDKISNNIDADLVEEAKYGKTACNAQELAMRQVQRDAEKKQRALSDMNTDIEDSKTNSISSEPPLPTDDSNIDSDRKNAVKDLISKINKARGGQ